MDDIWKLLCAEQDIRNAEKNNQGSPSEQMAVMDARARWWKLKYEETYKPSFPNQDANCAALDKVKASVKTEPTSTTQVGGTHYTSLAIQPWAAMEAWMTREQFIGYLIGNVIKYMARSKDDVAEDHKKAAHYLQKLIEVEGTK